ncbi:MAG: hypothetical protein KA163_05080 [Bacteroidia bacterium]|nr:hypothetical protein [Bacteroidia bacterium]
MLKFIRNTGDYFSSNYFDEDFTSKVLSKTGYNAEDVKEFNKKITPLKEKFFRYKELYIEGRLRTKDKIFETHQFHTHLLSALGYDAAHTQYDHLFHFTEEQVIPVRHILYRGDQPHLMVMEMQSLIKEDDNEPDGLFEQRYNVEDEEQANPAQKYHRLQWERVFTTPKDQKISPVIINKAVSQLFLLEPHQRPKYILLLAGNGLFLLEQEKWFRGSYLQFELEELFSEATANRNANYYALFYFLVGKETLAPDSNMVLLDQLDEDSHKSAYEVTKDLKEGIIHAVEALANEALFYLKEKKHEDFDETDDKFEQEIKDDCLRIIYRLLFIFYAESREDLDILPSNDSTYNKGYSLEMLRDLEQVPLYSENSLNGEFFHESLSKLFHVLSSGYREKENGHNKSFKVRHIDSPIFDDRKLHHLHKVKFRNKVWQDIICRLSLSKQQRNKARGRISYANLGINQLGSVYESLLAYRGFYAEQDYIEVHKKDKPEDGTYLVPRSRRDDFKEDEILKDENHQDVILKKGTFVYRLSGRDRQKSASYYTPEVLTRCTVKYTLKPILEKLEKGEMKAQELLDLKLLEPAMGAAAFHNEMINQLAEAYTSYRQKELRDSGRKEWKIEPDQYKEELQKVKAYIATHNVYGVDLNPTAIELGKLSLWLNVIHRDMETPFFSNRICVGNAVVGAWLKVYAEKDLIEEYEVIKSGKGKDKKALAKKEWWEKAPRQLEFKPNSDFDKIKTNRKQNEVYHFLLPDKSMVASAGIKLLKEENSLFTKGVATWKKEWIKPLTKTEFERVKVISNTIDELLAEYYRFQRNINLQTGSRQNIFGATKKNEQGILQMQSYDEKEKLADQRNRHSAPYFKLKMVMDYWCSLWFWDVRQADELPNRAQYWSDIGNILQLDIDKIVSNETEEKIQAGLQEKLFYTGGEQLALGEETDDAPKVFEAAVVEYAERKDLFDENQRLKIVAELSKKYFFFHPQLEFLEVFWERGGFDLMAGNPPWLKVAFEEKGILSEKFPEIAIRSVSAPQIRNLKTGFFSDKGLKNLYEQEIIETSCTASFMNGTHSYSTLLGQQTNLYKCILVNGFDLLGPNGWMGLIHPESVYEDSNGQALRKDIYDRLKYHFHFKNILKLFQEVHHRLDYGVNVYGKRNENISFISISNLLHPNQIEVFETTFSLTVDNAIIVKNTEGDWIWNLKGNVNRLIKHNEESLQLLADLFEKGESYKVVKLVNIQSSEVIQVLKKLSETKERISDKGVNYSEGFHETSSISEDELERKTISPDINKYELVLTGPMISVSYPLFKSPQIVSKEGSDYDFNDLLLNEDLTLPRTNLIPGKKFPFESKEINSFRVGFRKMVDVDGERTLQPALLAPKMGHINSILSAFHKDFEILNNILSLTTSILYDFCIKTIGSPNIYGSRIDPLPFKIESKFKSEIFLRVLRLNCIQKCYAPYWEELFKDEFIKDSWSCEKSGLEDISNVSKNWTASTPFRNLLTRRQALVEIDVLVAMNFGLTLEELVQIYLLNFSILKKFEDDTWYDTSGKIVFTPSSKTLRGVGVTRTELEQIKCLKAGEKYTYKITESEQFNGKEITFVAPFSKYNRVEDYTNAWKHFEKKLKDK